MTVSAVGFGPAVSINDVVNKVALCGQVSSTLHEPASFLLFICKERTIFNTNSSYSVRSCAEHLTLRGPYSTHDVQISSHDRRMWWPRRQGSELGHFSVPLLAIEPEATIRDNDITLGLFQNVKNSTKFLPLKFRNIR